jgi:hypothetical protein
MMKDADNPQNHTFGSQGVRLKHFEQVVTKILPSMEPKYVRLPPKLDDDSDWPFNLLPKSARVWGDNPGQLKIRSRAARKEGQAQNILRCALRLAPNDKPFTIIYFGGGMLLEFMTFFFVDSMYLPFVSGSGSGHLGIPLGMERFPCATATGSIQSLFPISFGSHVTQHCYCQRLQFALLIFENDLST